MTAPRPHSQPGNASELLPCPICSSRLAIVFERQAGLFVVSCENDDDHFTVEAYGSTSDDAVRQWNTRAPQPRSGVQTAREALGDARMHLLSNRALEADRSIARALAAIVNPPAPQAIFTCPRCPGFEKWCGDSNCPNKGSEPTAEEIETIMFGVINKLAMTRAHEAYWWLRKEFGSSAVSLADRGRE